MNCHQCPHSNNLAAGAFKDLPFEKTPCAKCQLDESSDFTMEYDDRRAASLPAPTAEDPGDDQPVGQEDAVMKLRSVAETLLQLPRKTRDMIFWRLSGLTYQDIAHIEGHTAAAVELRHRRAIAENPALAAIFAEKLQRAQRFNRTTRQPKEQEMNHTSAEVKALQSEARLLRAWIREVTTPKYRRLIQITAEMNQITGQRRIARPLEASAARRCAAKLLTENGHSRNSE